MTPNERILASAHAIMRVAMRHTGPPAVMHDSYFGGFASGFRVVYTDAKHYVWWTPEQAA